MPSMPVLSCILIMLVSVSELYTRLAYIIYTETYLPLGRIIPFIKHILNTMFSRSRKHFPAFLSLMIISRGLSAAPVDAPAFFDTLSSDLPKRIR